MPRDANANRTHVRWWTVALLVGLGSVVIALYVAVKLLLSLEQESHVRAFEPTRFALVSDRKPAKPAAWSDACIRNARL
jgi:hypothetical protein